MRTTRPRLGVLLAALAVVASACADGGADDGAGPKEGTPEPAAPTVGLAVTALETLAPETGGLFPTTAVDATSKAVYVAWAREVAAATDYAGDPLLEAVVARSDDGGATFGAPVVVSPPGMAVHTRSVSPTQVEVGPDGAVYVLFKHVEALVGYESPRRIMHLARSDDGGKTFGGPFPVGSEDVEGAVSSHDMLDLFVAPDGDVFVSFLDSREKVAAALANPGGEAPSGGGHGDLGEHLPQNQLRLTRSTDRGQTFSASTLVSKPVCVCCGTKVTRGEGTPLFATTRSEWKELKGSRDPVRDPFLSVSADDGATWSEATKIHDDMFKISGCPDVNAGLAVDRKGRLHAAWYTGTDRGPGVWYAVSDDDGRTFSEPVALLADDWVPYADVVMAVDGDGAAWVAYEDRRRERDQLQMARIDPDGAVTHSRPWPGHTPDLTAGAGGVLVAFSDLTDAEEEGDGTASPVRLARVTHDGPEPAPGRR